MRVQRTHTLTFSAPVEIVFPLFTPIHEKRWVKEWNPSIVYSETPTAEEKGAVFTTFHPDEPTALWINVDYDPKAYRVAYVKCVPGRYITLIEIQCRAGEKTRVDVSYTVTALEEAGYAYVEHFTEAYFRHHQMEAWQHAIDHYLTTGESL